MALLLTTISFRCFATGQAADQLIYKGDTLALFACPLDSYPDTLISADFLFDGRPVPQSTACWRGYIATWELMNDKLYLVRVNGCHSSSEGEEEVVADLKKLFPERYKDGKILADWVNGDLISPQGNLLYYVHSGFDRTYEKEVEFKIRKGILYGTTTYDNSKAKQRNLTDAELLTHIADNINWKDLPHLEKEVRVLVSFSADENGIVDRVKVVRGYTPIYDQEAMRVVKTLRDWDVYFKKGKHIRTPYFMPIRFNEKERH